MPWQYQHFSVLMLPKFLRKKNEFFNDFFVHEDVDLEAIMQICYIDKMVY